ncbi:MAG: ATP-binding cassette domain-containing protein [Acidimicrobiales bacterium]
MSSRYLPIVCRSLVKCFGATPVVDQLSFEVAAGSITGFVGANGSGKSTTMRMILGLIAPTAGEALVCGQHYLALAHPRREVGAVLEGPGAHPGHTARAHLEVTATAGCLPLTRVPEVLSLVELTEYAGRRIGTFSLGMRQRLALAGAMLGDPPVLILDEPANGLDPPGIIWMRDFLRGLAGEGRAVLISSHLLGELAEVADRVVIIDDGRLIADSTLAELLDGRSRVVELRCADPAAIADAMRDRGARTSVEGDLLVIEGSSAREVGEVAATIGAGPIYQLSERAKSFEDAYFELATLTPPSTTATNDSNAS